MRNSSPVGLVRKVVVKTYFHKEKPQVYKVGCLPLNIGQYLLCHGSDSPVFSFSTWREGGSCHLHFTGISTKALRAAVEIAQQVLQRNTTSDFHCVSNEDS